MKIQRLRCLDDHGLGGLLTDGHLYHVRLLPVGAVEVQDADDGSTLICSASRFAWPVRK